MSDLEKLRSRKNQNFDGEAHLTNEELDAMLACIEAAEALDLAILDSADIDRRPELSAAHGVFDAARAALTEALEKP